MPVRIATAEVWARRLRGHLPPNRASGGTKISLARILADLVQAGVSRTRAELGWFKWVCTYPSGNDDVPNSVRFCRLFPMRGCSPHFRMPEAVDAATLVICSEKISETFCIYCIVFRHGKSKCHCVGPRWLRFGMYDKCWCDVICGQLSVHNCN